MFINTLHGKSNVGTIDRPDRAPDRDSDNAWWSMRDDLPVADTTASDARLFSQVHDLVGTAILADVTDTMPACPTYQREPDLYDDGMAVWIGEECVVAVDIEAMARVHNIAVGATRLRWFDEPNRYGFVRLAPEHYGIRVETFDGDNPPAQVAWKMLTRTVSTFNL